MRLTSADGSAVDLRVVGYEFAAVAKRGDWDANWLVIDGHGQLATGDSWSFRDPCLTTWEAASLADWLRQVADGHVRPSPFPSDDTDALLGFTEPNLAFSLAFRTGSRIGLRVHFSLESRPPWVPDDEDTELFDFFVDLDLAESDVRASIESWSDNLAAYPAR